MWSKIATILTSIFTLGISLIVEKIYEKKLVSVETIVSHAKSIDANNDGFISIGELKKFADSHIVEEVDPNKI